MNAMDTGTFHKAPFVHFQRMMSDLFNSINIMHYWSEKICTQAPTSEEYQGHVQYEVLDQLVTWAKGNQLRTKGHPLYWPVPKAIPDWMAKCDLETRRKFLELRIRTITSRLKGKMDAYDAINEMMWEPLLANTYERHWPHIEPIAELADEAADVLRWAREEDPDARYILNEYGLFHGDKEPIPVETNLGGFTDAHQQLQRFVDYGKCLVDRGCAPDAMGIQTPQKNWGDYENLEATLDTIGNGTGLPVHVTEFRATTQHLEGLPFQERASQMTAYLEDLLTVCFGNPHLEAFYFWDTSLFFQPSRGVDVNNPEAPRQPSPVYEKLKELLTQRWMTHEQMRTDEKGEVHLRAFTGEYTVRVPRPSGQQSGYPFSLSGRNPDGITETIRVDW